MLTEEHLKSIIADCTNHATFLLDTDENRRRFSNEIAIQAAREDISTEITYIPTLNEESMSLDIKFLDNETQEWRLMQVTVSQVNALF